MPTADSQHSLFAKVTLALFSRLVLNTARRFAYPFAPALSRGMDVPLTAITSLIAVNQSTSVIGLFFGPVADRLGYRLIMMLGLGLLAVGMFAAGFIPLYGLVLLALFLAGLGKSIYDPALQAYISQRVSYHRRGLIIGILEFSWAGASLVGIPLIGVLIDRLGWRSPFFLLGGLALLALVLMIFLFSEPKGKPRPEHSVRGFGQAVLSLVKEKPALGALGYAFCMSVANDTLFVIYGVWLESEFELSLVALGASTSIIGLAELVGEGMTASLADKIGLKRAAVIGLILLSICYLALPLFSHNYILAMVGLFFLFLIFEFTIVTSISIATELLPSLRATMMSGFYATAGIGRVIGALIGGVVWLAGGMAAIAGVAGGMTIMALAALLWGLKAWSKSV
ncbi:MAG: MFS transporter [Desulfobacterales bacterium]|nr:MFS transporter [Desulfobacterales bacterium]